VATDTLSDRQQNNVKKLNKAYEKMFKKRFSAAAEEVAAVRRAEAVSR
jgi:hypothetical protein